MYTLAQLITKEMETAFNAAGYDAAYAKVTLSNRPDLCEYQCNGAMAAAKEALHRCKVQGEKAAGVMKNGAALYENGYLVGAVGIYGGNEKMNNEKAQLAMEMLKGAVQR